MTTHQKTRTCLHKFLIRQHLHPDYINQRLDEWQENRAKEDAERLRRKSLKNQTQK